MSSSGYGLVAEFASTEALLAAVRAARRCGYRRLEAYTPFSVPGLPEALALPRDRVALTTLLGGGIGGAGGFFMQWYAAVLDYPINSGGRPLDSWPAFIPVTFELAVLGGALAAFGGMLALNGLPRLRHPIFDTADFHLASRNRFFLCVRADDPLFDDQRTRSWLATLSPVRIAQTPAAAAEPAP
jgi:hypothetical protein